MIIGGVGTLMLTGWEGAGYLRIAMGNGPDPVIGDTSEASYQQSISMARDEPCSVYSPLPCTGVATKLTRLHVESPHDSWQLGCDFG